MKYIKKVRFLWLLAAGIGLLAFGVPNQLQSRAVIHIDSPSAKKIPIAIPNLAHLGSADPALGGQMAQLLAKDLDFTGYFQWIDPKGFLGRDAEKNIDFQAWGLTGAELLVKGSYQATGAKLQWTSCFTMSCREK